MYDAVRERLAAVGADAASAMAALAEMPAAALLARRDRHERGFAYGLQSRVVHRKRLLVCLWLAAVSLAVAAQLDKGVAV